MIVEPTFISLLIIVVEQVRLKLNKLVKEHGHATENLVDNHRGPKPECQRLSGLLVCDVLKRPRLRRGPPPRRAGGLGAFAIFVGSHEVGPRLTARRGKMVYVEIG